MRESWSGCTHHPVSNPRLGESKKKKDPFWPPLGSPLAIRKANSPPSAAAAPRLAVRAKALLARREVFLDLLEAHVGGARAEQEDGAAHRGGTQQRTTPHRVLVVREHLRACGCRLGARGLGGGDGGAGRQGVAG